MTDCLCTISEIPSLMVKVLTQTLGALTHTFPNVVDLQGLCLGCRFSPSQNSVSWYCSDSFQKWIVGKTKARFMRVSNFAAFCFVFASFLFCLSVCVLGNIFLALEISLWGSLSVLHVCVSWDRQINVQFKLSWCYSCGHFWKVFGVCACARVCVCACETEQNMCM